MKSLVILIFFILLSCQSSIDVNSVLNNTSSDKCPSGYILVEGNGILGTVDFCVMKFEAKDVDNVPTSQAAGIPWGSITATDAQAACESISSTGFNGTFSLISNREWMTIARDIENTAINWSDNIVGSGKIPRGVSDGSPADPVAVSDETDYYSDTGNSALDAMDSGWEQKRVHFLSNGNVLWDLAGNSYEWTDWDDSDSGFTTGPTDEATFWKEFTEDPVGSSLTDEDYRPENTSYGTGENFGQWYGGTSGGAALRGGTSDKDEEAGIFTLLLPVASSSTSVHFGFRCVYRP